MTVTTTSECVEFVNRVGICTWRHIPRISWFPSLENETPWRGPEVTNQTWFWKDDLHIERALYFGMLVAPDTPVFVSLTFLPLLIAAQGDIDARTLFENGELPVNALKVYEHVERNGPTTTSAMPWAPGSRMLYLAILQQKFLLTKQDLTGRMRGTYGYRWCLAEDAFPAAFVEAARVRVEDARSRVFEHLKPYSRDLTYGKVAMLFRWPQEKE